MDYMNIPYEEEENSGILGILTLGRSVPQLKVNKIRKEEQLTCRTTLNSMK